MKRTRSKSKVKQPAPTAAETRYASTPQAIHARLEEGMKSLAETAKKTSNPMELVRALLKMLPLDQRK
jgi:hypothetical protein